MLKASGYGGLLKFHWLEAARLDEWRLDGYSLQAKLLSVDEFWIDHRPLALSLRVGKSVWLWPEVNRIHVAGNEITVKLEGNPSNG